MRYQHTFFKKTHCSPDYPLSNTQSTTDRPKDRRSFSRQKNRLPQRPAAQAAVPAGTCWETNAKWFIKIFAISVFPAPDLRSHETVAPSLILSIETLSASSYEEADLVELIRLCSTKGKPVARDCLPVKSLK